MSEISVRMSGGSDPFIDLGQMYLIPGNVFFSQSLQHDPRSVTAADCKYKTTALGGRRSCLRGNEPGGLLSHCLSICKCFNLHKNTVRNRRQRSQRKQRKRTTDERGFTQIWSWASIVGPNCGLF